MSAEEIWDDLVESVVTETAAQLHQLIKTGGLTIASSSSSSSSSSSLEDRTNSSSILEERRSLYPDLYPTDEALQQDLDQFAVEQQQPAAKRMRLETTTAASATTPVIPSVADNCSILADPDNKVVEQELEPTTIETPSMQLLVVPQDAGPPSQRHPNEETLDEVVCATTTITTTSAATTTLNDDDDIDDGEPPDTSTTTTLVDAGADTVPSTAAVLPSSLSAEPQPSVVVVPSAAARHNFNNTDIWGRNPAKEPFSLISCSTCRNQVSGLRFASHLDKCLGIGTMSRNASSHGNRKS